MNTLYALVAHNCLFWCTNITEMTAFCTLHGFLGQAEEVTKVDFEVPQVKLIHIFQ